ncbi:carbohydrate ABC transporter permease [Cucumibacter marinus]|uniref:carbohydrate ABC transporter permease n=1 Tax=Cucumibacter marinus TaxID=1121252 RepID=UPI001FE220D5|nr:carbohydrate ABC transporter permease [Cucumibacter marinus]
MTVRKRAMRIDWATVFTWVAVIVVFLLPMVWIVLKALQPEQLVFSGTIEVSQFTLENFERAITQGSLLSYTISNTIIALATCAIVVPLGYVTGYALARFRFPGRGSFLFLFMFSLTIPGLVNLVAIYQLFSALRMINNPVTLVIVYSASSLPLAVWLMRAYIMALPAEIEEAALIDGCSRFGILWRIVLPIALPGVGAVTVLTIVAVFHEFIVAQTMMRIDGIGVVNQGLRQLQTEHFFDFTGLAAGSVLVSLVPVALFLLLQRQFISGMTAGAIKS